MDDEPSPRDGPARPPRLQGARAGASGFEVTAQPLVVLYAKSGYTDGLRAAAERDPLLVLVDVAEMLGNWD